MKKSKKISWNAAKGNERLDDEKFAQSGKREGFQS